jgi:predicted Zn-ribbon and HTH transcriptional regulator
MVMASVKCPECGFDIEIELPEKKSLIIRKCPKCKKDIRGPDRCCITVCRHPYKGE